MHTQIVAKRAPLSSGVDQHGRAREIRVVSTSTTKTSDGDTGEPYGQDSTLNALPHWEHSPSCYGGVRACLIIADFCPETENRSWKPKISDNMQAFFSVSLK
ncbi:unnamed protein product [Pylaiella littoralis]